MNDLYTLAFNFWQLFATKEVEVGGSVALTNSNVPLLLSNAAWFPKADDFQSSALQDIATHYAERDIVPALVVPAVRDEAFNKSLGGSAFSLEGAFTFLEAESNMDTENTNLISEQVSWAQGRVLGEHLAAHYGFLAYGVQLGAAITAAMQRCSEIVSFAAYGTAGEVAGALVALETPTSFVAMLSSGAVDHRLVQEAASRNLQALSLALLPPGVTVKNERSFERWSVR